jgi:hypothetical protein
MKSLLAIFISSVLVVSAYSQTRNVLVNSNNAVVQPTNFWSVDASNARTGLGLGSAATNPASAFQPSSGVLSNLASSNAVNLTNLRATNVVGTLSLTQGGTGATNAATARTAFGLDTAATNPASAFQPSSAVLSNLATSNGANLTNIQASNLVGTITTNLGIQFDSITATNGESIFEDLSVLDEINAAQATFGTNTNIVIIGSSGISFGSSSVAATTRTNLGLGATWLTNTNVTNFRTDIGLGISNGVSFESISAINGSIKVLEGTNEVVLLNSDEAAYFAYPINFLNTNALNETRNHLGIKRIVTTDQGVSGWITAIYDDTNATNPIIAVGGQAGVTLYGAIGFGGANTTTNKIISRNNLGLGWSALTNTNTSGFNTSLYGSGTNPVLYDTNGEVVSPTNFWQVAPIVTRFVEFDPPTNATTNIVAARNLHIHSLAISRTGVTSTIALPTNGAFNGDIALVVHQGPTSSVTAVRTAGAGTDLVTLNQFDESVEFVFYDNVWQFNHNRSFIEPIYFSGTNAAANAAASRTNLGVTTVGNALFTATNDAVAATAIGLGATNNVSFSNVTASGTLTVTSTVTAKTNLVVEGFVDYTAARTNNTPTNTPNFAAHAAWIEVKVGTNSFFLPAYK